jgi:hypothetical protein
MISFEMFVLLWLFVVGCIMIIPWILSEIFKKQQEQHP